MKKIYLMFLGLIMLVLLSVVVSADSLNTYSETMDGYVSNVDVHGWSATRDALSGSSSSSNAQYTDKAVYSKYFFGQYQLSRAFFNFTFDSIPSYAVIESATLYIYGKTNAQQDLIVVACDDLGSTLDTSDFGKVNFDKNYSGEITSWSTSGYNAITLNTDAINDIQNSVTNENYIFHLALIEHDYDYSNVAPTSGSNGNGLYWADYPTTSYKPYLNISYILDTNSPPYADTFINGSGETLDFCRPSFSAKIYDNESDLMNYSFWIKDGANYVKVKEVKGVNNCTVYFNTSDYTDNYFTCLGTTYYWKLRITDNESKETHIVNYTKSFKFDVSPHPYEDMDCTPNYYWKQIGSMNTTEVSVFDYRLVNYTNNYTWCQAVSNGVVLNRTYYFNHDWETWVFNYTVPAYEGVIVALNYSDYTFYYPIQTGGGDADESMDITGFVNFTLNNESWANIGYHSWFNDSNSDTLETSLSLINQHINNTWDTDESMFLSDFFNISLNYGSWANITINSWFNDSSSDTLEHNYILNQQFINNTGGSGCIYPYYVNYSDDNVTVNITITGCGSSVINNATVNDDSWLYIAGLSLENDTIALIIVIVLFVSGIQMIDAIKSSLCLTASAFLSLTILIDTSMMANLNLFFMFITFVSAGISFYKIWTAVTDSDLIERWKVDKE